MTIANQFAPVWNASGVNFSAIRANVTDVASSGGSTLLDLRVNDSGVFSVNKTGAVTFAGNSLQGLLDGKLSLTGGTLTGGLSGTTGTFSSTVNVQNTLSLGNWGVNNNRAALVLNGDGSSHGWISLRWPETAWGSWGLDTGAAITTSTRLYTYTGFGISLGEMAYNRASFTPRFTFDGANWVITPNNLVEQRNSTNAQRFNLYGTYTDASNYRRLYLSSTTAGAFTLGVEGAGTGASGNTLTVASNISFSGTATFSGEGVFNSFIRTSNSGIVISELIIRRSSISGIIEIADNSENFKSIQLGGRTNQHPAIVRTGAAINFRLADGSGDAPITASNGTFSGHLSATTKSFLIDHPTKPGRKLQYGSLESPYHGIRLTGRSFVEGGIGVIDLPDYVRAFVSDDVNIQLTPVGRNILWVDCIDLNNNQVIVGGDLDGDFYWSFTGIRTDVELEVEPWA